MKESVLQGSGQTDHPVNDAKQLQDGRARVSAIIHQANQAKLPGLAGFGVLGALGADLGHDDQGKRIVAGLQRGPAFGGVPGDELDHLQGLLPGAVVVAARRGLGGVGDHGVTPTAGSVQGDGELPGAVADNHQVEGEAFVDQPAQ